MQSTVIINCTRGRGGLFFATSHNITVEGLTIINCSGAKGVQYNFGVLTFVSVQSLLFLKNSIQHMNGNGLYLRNCSNAIITNSSYYHSALCGKVFHYGSGVHIDYDSQYSNTTLELSYSNMTKCCGVYGGGLVIQSSHSYRGLLKISLNNLYFSYNKGAEQGGGMSAYFFGSGNVTLVVSNCIFFNGTSTFGGGMNLLIKVQSFSLIIDNTVFLNNYGGGVASDISIGLPNNDPTNHVLISMLNSTMCPQMHTPTMV